MQKTKMKTYDVTVTIQVKVLSEQDALDFVHNNLVRLEDDPFYVGYSDATVEEVKP